MADDNAALWPCMYPHKLPKENDLVHVKVIDIGDSVSEVSLSEYGNRKAIISHAQLSRKRIKSIRSIIRVGKEMILQVYKVSGNDIDLTNHNIDAKDSAKFRKRYNDASSLFMLCNYLSKKLNCNWSSFYEKTIISLYRELEIMAADNDNDPEDSDNDDLDDLDDLDEIVSPYSVIYEKAHEPDALRILFADKGLSEDELNALIASIQNRLLPVTYLDASAHVIIKCYTYNGILDIQAAIRYALQHADRNVHLSITMLCSPVYLVKVICNSQECNPKEQLAKACLDISKELSNLCVLTDEPCTTHEGKFQIKKLLKLRIPKKMPKQFTRK